VAALQAALQDERAALLKEREALSERQAEVMASAVSLAQTGGLASRSTGSDDPRVEEMEAETERLRVRLAMLEADKAAEAERVSRLEAEKPAEAEANGGADEAERLRAGAVAELREQYGDNKEHLIAALRELLLNGAADVEEALNELQMHVKVGEATSRAGYLRSLEEQIGPKPLKRGWEDEWVEMYVENVRHRQGEPTEDDIRKHSPEQLKLKYKASSASMEAAGWPRERAELVMLMASMVPSIGAAMRERSGRYAAATYALSEALHAQLREAGEPPPMMFKQRTGPYSLTQDDPAWENLEEPDRTGFCGLTSTAPLYATRDPNGIGSDGYQRYSRSRGKYEVIDSDVIGFESLPTDEHGCHAAILRQAEPFIKGIYPPNTLFRLKKVLDPGFWTSPFDASVYPKCRLLVVTATFRPPHTADAEQGGHGKMCDTVRTLSYGTRAAFITGMDDVTAKTTLTMAQELKRDITWVDWKGVTYKLDEEYRYVLGPATPAAKTPGERDANNSGKTLEQFLREVNEFIRKRRANLSANQDLQLPEAHAFLSLDEVVAVRMYSGPAYQPINEFLRAVGQLQGVYRERLIHDVATSFAATVGQICNAIRKLAAITSPGEATKPLFRGVRGELPKSFWVEDKQGMVCAVDMAFMSTSRNRTTPVDYMGSGKNVLWELQPEKQSDVAYHRGADIRMLSQFAMEDEVLFPPCTLLEVLKHGCFAAGGNAREEPAEQQQEDAGQASTPGATSSGESLPTNERRGPLEEYVPRYFNVIEDSHASKRFMSVKVLPSFV